MELADLVARIRLDTSGLNTGLASANAAVSNAGHSMGRAGRAMTTGVTLPLAGIAAAGVAMAADFDTTMRRVSIATGGPTESLKQLAMQMGQDTVFSASDAADAMLELAKGGMTAAQIKGGALAATMKIAAIEEMSLAEASTITSNNLQAFGLRAKDADSVVTALAGGANASSASVLSLSEGLSNVGGSARNAGLTINDTVGVLSLFDANALKGAEAGTNLRSMLNALTPATDKAREAMAANNLEFTNADGSFKSMAGVARELQKELGGMTEAQRAATLETIFGSYGQRAATILMREGAAGVREYTAATFDSQTANAMAQAGMTGLAGAIEAMKGSLETAILIIGDVLEPIIIQVANGITKAANAFTSLPPSMQGAIVAMGALAAIVGPLLIVLGALVAAIGAIGLPVAGVIVGITALVAALTGAYATSNTFRTVVTTALGAVAAFATGVLIPGVQSIIGAFQGLIAAVVPIVLQIAGVIQQHMPQIKSTFQEVWSTVKVIVTTAMAAIKANIQMVTAVITALWNTFGGTIKSTIQTVFPAILQIITGVMQTIRGVVQTVTALIKGDWTGVWNGLKTIASGALNALAGIVQAGLGVVRGIVSAIGDAIAAVFGTMWDKVTGIWRAGIGAVVGLAQSMVGQVRGALGGLVSAAASIASNMVSALAGGIRAAAGSVADAARDMVSGAIDAAKGMLKIGSPSKEFQVMGLQVTEGLAIGIEADATPKMREAAEKVIDAFREKLRQRIDSLRTEVTSLRDSIVEAFSRTGSMLGVEARVDAEGVKLPITAEDVIAARQAAAGRAGEFTMVLQQLKEAGLSQPQLEELAAAGPEALEVAKATLAGGGAAIESMNQLQLLINQAGKNAAAIASAGMVEAGLKGIDGLVEGLKDQDGKIAKRMRQIAREMVKELRQELRIHSPSGVFFDIGMQSGEGFVGGLVATERNATHAARALGAAATLALRRTNTLAGGVDALRSAYSGSGAPPTVRVYIGDKELTDIVSVEVDEKFSPLRTYIRQGA